MLLREFKRHQEQHRILHDLKLLLSKCLELRRSYNNIAVIWTKI